MFREFNVKFEDAEMLGGTDNLLEGTEVTKVVLRGENNFSSLDSALKNCNELDTIDGDINLKNVKDIDNLLDGTQLVKTVNLANINNANMSINNPFPNVEEINIGGEIYDKAAIQNVIASKDWTYEGFDYKDKVEENIVIKEINIVDDNKLVIKDTLEQKAKGIEIIGQTYENLVVGNGEVTLLDELTLESVDGSTKEFNPHIEQPVCVEVVEGQTYQNLVNGEGEYKLTDTFSATWTESNNSIDNAPAMIEISEIWGNTIQGYANEISYQAFIDNFNGIKTTGGGTFKAVIMDDGTVNIQKSGGFYAYNMDFSEAPPITLKPNTQYSLCLYNALDNTPKKSRYIIVEGSDVLVDYSNGDLGCAKFTTKSSGAINIFPCSSGIYNIMVVEGDVELDTFTYDEVTLESIRSVGDLYVDENNEPILDEEGNEQYRLDIINKNINLMEYKEFSSTAKNITCSSTKDGVITVKSDRSGGYQRFNLCTGDYGTGLFGNEGMDMTPIITGAGTYNFSFKSSGTSSNTITLIVVYDDNKVQDFYLSHSGRYNITANKCINHVQLNCWYGDNVIDITFSELQITKSTSTLDYVKPQSNKTTILMPCKLMKVSDGRDRLFWDISKNKYIIEKNVRKMIINEDTRFITERNQNGHTLYNIDTYQSSKPNGSKFINDTFPTGTDFSDTTSEWMMAMWSSKLYLSISNTRGRVNEWFRDNPTTVYYHSTIPETIETKILEKPSLETYSPKTYTFANSEVQPSQMSITNKKAILSPMSLQANTDYTLQLDSVGKDSKNITVNLGGTETTIQPTNDTSKHHKVVVRTPAALTNDTLELSGEGVLANDVMLFQGGSDVIKQEVGYIEGIENIGVPTTTKNILKPIFTLQNIHINEGSVWNDANFFLSDYIEVEENTNYIFNGGKDSNFTASYVAFDENKSWLGSKQGSSWQTPLKTKYIRVRIGSGDKTNYPIDLDRVSEYKMQVEKGNSITEYQEYYEGEKYKIDILSANSKYTKPIMKGLVSWVNYEDYNSSSKTVVDRITNEVISCEGDSNGLYGSKGVVLGSLPVIKTIECNGVFRDTTTNENGTTINTCTIFYGNANGVTVGSRCRTNDNYSYCDSITGHNFFYNTPYQGGWQNDLNAEGKKNEYLNGGLFYCSLKTNVEDIPLNFGYFPHGGATLNRYKDILVYDRELTVEEVEHNKKYHRLRSVAKEDLSMSKQSILLPQPLNKIGDIKDRLYWDEDKGHYCIEENVPKIYLHTLDWTHVVNTIIPEDEMSFMVGGYCQNNNITTPSFNENSMKSIIKHNIPILSTSINNTTAGVDSFGYHGSGSIYFRTKRENLVDNSLIQYLKEKGYFIIVTRPTPNIIDLPNLNEKYSLDTYMPSTYIECTDAPLQPSRILLESNTHRYKPTFLKSNTEYTVQFDCKERGNKKVVLDLGGTRKEFNAQLGLNHVSITTNSELTKDRLYLSGVGNTLSDIMLVEGSMNQYPSYFDGVQSVGELQENGSYMIDMEISSEHICFEKNDCIPFVSGTIWYTDFLKNKVEVVPNTTYHALVYGTISDSFKGLQVRCYSKDGIFIEQIDTSAGRELKDQGRFTVPQDCYYINFRMYTYEITGDMFSSRKIILYKGSLDDVVSSKNMILEKVRPISKLGIALSQALMKAGDIADRLYWDKSKKCYCVEHNISHKTFDELVFTGGSVTDNVFTGWGNFTIAGGHNWKIEPVINHGNKHIKKIDLYNRGSYTEMNVTVNNCTSIDEANMKIREDLPISVTFAVSNPNVIDLTDVEGDVIDLPRLFQREDTTLKVETGNIKPSEIKIEYLDLN